MARRAGNWEQIGMSDTADYIDQFRDAMVQRGLNPPDEIIADGNLHRCDVEGRNGRDDGAYILHCDGIPAGGFQNWKDGRDWENWRADLGRSITATEEKAYRAKVKAQRALRAAEEARRHDAAAAEAIRRLKAASTNNADSHPYILAKGIRAHGVAVAEADGTLLVPMRDIDGKLWNVERISATDFQKKRGLSGGRRTSCFFSIGKPDDLIVIAEGYATGCSIHEASGLPVAVTFNCGNLLPVAKALRAKYPSVGIIVAADDDSATDGNPGLRKASEVAHAVGGVFAVPELNGERLAGGADFNDLHVAHGVGPVRTVLDAAKAMLTSQVAHPENAGKLSNLGNMVNLIRASDLKPESISWVWRYWLAEGKLQILAGPPGVGKTTVAGSLAATVSVGGHWPDGSRCESGNVLIWSGEDGVTDTLLPRLLAAGADPSRVYFVTGSRVDGEDLPFDPARDMAQLAAEAQAIGNVRLLIVDPVVSAVAGDSHKNTEVRRALQPLVDLGASLGCAVLGISHFSKGSGGRDPIERVTGSIAFSAVARTVLVASKAKTEDGHDCRLLARAKSNLGPDDGAFEYTLEQRAVPGHTDIDASVVTWGAEVAGTARELLAEPEPDEDNSARGAAEAFLRDLLKDGPVPKTVVEAEAKAAGHSWSTVRRASDRMGVIKSKGVDRWYWRLAKLPNLPKVPNFSSVSNVDNMADAEAF
jgi:putative DNA primase/helicase